MVSSGSDAIRAQPFPRGSNEGILVVCSINENKANNISLRRTLSKLRKVYFLSS